MRSGIALCAASMVACGGGTGSSRAREPAQDAGVAAVHAVYALADAPMPFGAIPWPDDAYLDASGHVSVTHIPTPAPADYAAALADAMGDLDGFGIRPTIYFRFDGELDPMSLPVAPEESLKSDAGVFLIDADTSSPDAFERIPVEVEYDADSQELRVRPGGRRALTPGRRYAAVATRSVRAASGEPVAASAAFVRVRDPQALAINRRERAVRAAYAPVLETLASRGLPRSRVVALAVFHVQTVRADLSRARELVRQQRASAPPAVLRAAVTGADLDSALGTPASGALGLDDGAPHDHIGWMIHGSFEVPNFLSPRTGVHGAFRRSVAGDLRVRRSGDVFFTLLLPRGVLATAPLPVVIVQHGLDGERSDALPVANALAASGYAVIALDAPFHGSSAPGGDQRNRFTGAPMPDGFGDVPADFLGAQDDAGELTPLHPFYYRDAVRQGVVDLMGLVAWVEEGDWSQLAALDPALAGVRLEGAGIGFVGFDLGAEMGMILSTYEPSVAALVLGFTGGEGIDGWLESPGRSQLADAVLSRLGHAPDTVDFAAERPLEWPDVDAWRTLTDRASAMAHAPTMRRLPRSALMLMARNDETVDNQGSEALADALGAEISGGEPNYVLELPVHAVRPGATLSGNVAVDGGTVTRVLYVLDPATHDALIFEHGEQAYQLPLERPFVARSSPLSVDNPLAATAMQVAFFFESYRACRTATPNAVCAASVQAPPGH